MAQPVTVYRWDDPGAPQLPDGKPSEIINILTKCLVEGYGDKTPLGWTKPFYDTTNQAAAFRNNVAAGGSGGYAKFYSANNSDSNNALMRLTHSISMIDINNLFNQGYTCAFRAEALTGINKMDKWALIGTPTAFYFFISRNDKPMGNTNEYNPTMFCGDFYSTIPNDVGRFIAMANPDTVGDSASVNINSTLDRLSFSSDSSDAPIKAYDADGFNAWAEYAVIHQLGSYLGTSADYDAAPPYVPALYPVLVWGRFQYTSVPSTADRLGVTLQNSVIRPPFRGVLPGFYISAYAGWRAEAWPKVLTLSDGDYWLLRTPSAVGGCRLMVNLVAWNDPFSAL